jgi:osmoprotectant transport system permease protein
MTWVEQNLGLIWQLTLTHLAVSIVPIVLGALIAVVLARLLRARSALVATAILSAIFAIPSLALFVLLPPLIGTPYLGPSNVIIALTLYAIATMFFSARDAFSSLDANVIEFARAQGFSVRQMVFSVELPLALPALIAGMRVVAASTVSLASIGAVVGVRNLGYLFLDGFQRRIPEEILTGIVMTAIIALLFDLSLWLLGRQLTPWRRVRDARAGAAAHG